MSFVINTRNPKKSFTIIETMIVVIIIGIMAAISVATYRNIIESSKQAEATGILTTLYKGYKQISIIEKKMKWGDERIEGKPFVMAVDNSADQQAGTQSTFWYLGIGENLNIDPYHKFSYLYFRSPDIIFDSSQEYRPSNNPIFCAIKRKTAVPLSYLHLDFDKFICIDCNDAKIYKSSSYY